jgi:serine/threonine protein kinase
MVELLGQVKITDFGLTREKDFTGSLRTAAMTGGGGAGDAPGTLCWMAPEILKGERCAHLAIPA